MTSVLVSGGAGYIGSHTSLQLSKANHDVVVLDNLYSGHRWAVPQGADFYQGDIGDPDIIRKIIKSHDIEAVVHFAGHIVVPESVADPLKYYRNNVAGSLNLIQCCTDAGVNRFIFSSSAAVYGIPISIPVSENADKNPINPYGLTKLMTEWTLSDLAAANLDFRYVALRYFNVAGAHIGGGLGQATPEATHLIKVACQAATGQRPSMSVFGDDYDTADGTCIRDYIHVDDLAVAHLDALNYLSAGGDSLALNCGYGRGYSVREVIDMVKSVSGIDFKVIQEGRRAGDPAALIADNTQIKQTFNWEPRYADLQTICRSAYEWELNLLESGRSRKG